MNDLSGMKFARLTVLEYAYSRKKQRVWKCLCDCGNIVYTTSNSLLQGNTKSCGCLQKEKAAANGKRTSKHGLSHDKNGRKTRLFRIWGGIKTRCLNPNDKAYTKYGGRGITICPDWENSFKSFYDWALSNGYSDDLTIDRIDVNGNYEPSNCRWATAKQQASNRTNNRLLTYNGETKTVSEFAKEYGLSQQCLHNRIKRGWSIERALKTK